jgi:hypothetical protein
MSDPVTGVLNKPGPNVPITPPFVGLRYFEENDASLFYGRDEHTADILGKIARDRFVAVLGSSGSGKSSLVRAGLIPELRAGMIPHAGPRWRVVEFRPGNAPIDELARSVRSSLNVTNASSIIEEGPLGLFHAVKAARLPENTNVLVIADQFEEIFRFEREQHDQGCYEQAIQSSRALVRKLLDAVDQSEVSIYILLVVRSDYLGECSQFEELPERMSKSMYLVPRLRRDQIQEVITAAIANNIEPALVQELLGKAGRDPEQLPRLQHLLRRMWALAAGGRLTMQQYADAGCWEEALERNLNEVYTGDGLDQRAFAVLFKQLSEVDETGRVVRRRAPSSDLVELGGPAVTSVISALRDEGFVRRGEPIDITHECILRNWSKVKDWLREEGEARDFYREVRARQKRNALLSGADLTTAERYLNSGYFSPAWARRYGSPETSAAVNDFVATSAKTERKSTRLNQILRYGLIASILIAFVGLVLAVWGAKERNSALAIEASTERALAANANRKSIEAERQAKLAQEERVIAEKAAAVAASEKKRADSEAANSARLTAALQQYISRGGATSSQLTTSSTGSPVSHQTRTGRELAELYNFPSELNGRGQTIAFIELGGGYIPSDIERYFKSLNLRIPEVTSVSIDGGMNNPAETFGIITAEIESAGSVAPSARVVVYFAPNTSQGFTDAVAAAINDATNAPSVIGIAWGGPEQVWGTQGLEKMNEVLQRASTRGITVVCNSGVSGVTDGLANLRAVDFPASSPWVLAVGATRLKVSDGRITAETAWNDGDKGGASGGGVSTVFPAPDWQAKIIIPTLPGQTAAMNGRALPDVAADSHLRTSFWVGAIALLNQALGRNIGYLNPVLYEKFGPAGIFRDITEGNNNSGKVKGYSAAPGWNAVTGWGSPDGAKLLEALKELSR